MPELIGIGVGPGDPDLLTVKAVKAIQNADVIMCPASKEDRPSIALSVVNSTIDKSKNQEIVKLIFPMTKDKDILEAHWKENSKVAGITSEFQLLRNDFGVGTGDYISDVVIGNEINITLNLELTTEVTGS